MRISQGGLCGLLCILSSDFMFIAIGGEIENTWIVVYSFVGFSDGSGANFYPFSENVR
ncbi:MAG: hypothetical protein WAP53_01455 [Dysgonamonadaceae bacterium]